MRETKNADWKSVEGEGSATELWAWSNSPLGDQEVNQPLY